MSATTTETEAWMVGWVGWVSGAGGRMKKMRRRRRGGGRTEQWEGDASRGQEVDGRATRARTCPTRARSSCP